MVRHFKNYAAFASPRFFKCVSPFWDAMQKFQRHKFLLSYLQNQDKRVCFPEIVIYINIYIYIYIYIYRISKKDYNNLFETLSFFSQMSDGVANIAT